MREFVTSGSFKPFDKEEDFQKDKEMFFAIKKNMLSFLLYEVGNSPNLTENQISQMDDIIKYKFAQKEDKEIVSQALDYFLSAQGISYKLLNEEEKKKLLIIDYTYENFKDFSSDIYKKYIKDVKAILPFEMEICCQEKGFFAYCYGNCDKEIKKDNYLDLIKLYFFFDIGYFLERYRNNELFINIRDDLIDIYPKYKAPNVINRYLEKFLSFFEPFSDYNNKLLKKGLDNYYNNKTKKGYNDNKNKENENNEYTPLKLKQD